MRFRRAYPGGAGRRRRMVGVVRPGMGERTGIVGAVVKAGLTPISPSAGVVIQRQVLADPSAGPVLVIGGRAPRLAAPPVRPQELSDSRYLGRVITPYLGDELVGELEVPAGDALLPDAKPVLSAHVVAEAMTEIAGAVTGKPAAVSLDEIAFLRPVLLAGADATTLRLVAQVGADQVEVVLRSSETGYHADRARAGALPLTRRKSQVSGARRCGCGECPARAAGSR